MTMEPTAMEREHWDRRYADAELLWPEEANRFLVQEAAGLPPGRALDVGTGEGRNAIWLAARGWRVTATDFSAVALDKARRIAAARGVDVEWIEADLRAYTPPSHAFDLVLVMYMHPLPPERRTLVRTAAGALADGGTLLVVGHDRTNLAQGIGGPQDPDRLFSPDDIVGDLAGIDDLHVVRAERVLRPVTTEKGERNAIDALVRIERQARSPIFEDSCVVTQSVRGGVDVRVAVEPTALASPPLQRSGVAT